MDIILRSFLSFNKSARKAFARKTCACKARYILSAGLFLAAALGWCCPAAALPAEPDPMLAQGGSGGAERHHSSSVKFGNYPHNNGDYSNGIKGSFETWHYGVSNSERGLNRRLACDFLEIANNCYANGQTDEAVKLYRMAAELGNTDAQSSLGSCYYEGQGVPQDYGEAVNWYSKAAEQGHEEAKRALELLGK